MIQRVVELMPTRLNNRIRGTFVESIFNKVEEFRYRRSVTFNTYSFSSPVGEFTLDIPATGPWSSFGEVYEDTSSGHEPALVADLAKEASSETVFYDVGSQHGYISKAAQQAGIKPENIHALEAHSGLAYVTFRNCPEIIVQQTCVGSQTNGIKISLDDYAAQNASPDIIKIDVEGMEYDVVKGAEKLLRKGAIWYIEIHPKQLKSQSLSVSDILDEFQQYGYNLFSADHRSASAEFTEMDDQPSSSEAWMLKAVR